VLDSPHGFIVTQLTGRGGRGKGTFRKGTDIQKWDIHVFMKT
jgi:hypothetical protein